MLERTYRPETYRIVLSSGSPLKEEIDQVLLKFRVDGTYDDLLSKWFGIFTHLSKGETAKAPIIAPLPLFI